MKDNYTYKTIVCYAKIALYVGLVFGVSMVAAFYALTELVSGFIQ